MDVGRRTDRSHRCSIQPGCVDSYLCVVDGFIQAPFTRPVTGNTRATTYNTGGPELSSLARSDGQVDALMNELTDRRTGGWRGEEEGLAVQLENLQTTSCMVM